jgi:hypothetical protein
VTEESRPKPFATHYANATATISGDLIANVRLLLLEAWKEMVGGTGLRHGINGSTKFALPAFIVTVAAVEAFLNESFLSDMNNMLVKGTGLDVVSREWIEERDLLIKLVLVPYLTTGKTLSQAEQPYQDMKLLVRLRNDLVHYKMGGRPHYVRDLAQRGIAIRVPAAEEEAGGGPMPWVDRVSTSEGIRWAYNTACATVHAVVALMPPSLQEAWGRMSIANFFVISEETCRKELRGLGVTVP